MVHLKHLSLVYLVFQLFSFIKCDLSLNDNDLYFMEQSIEDGEFKEIGNLNIRLVKQSQNSARIQSLNEDDDEQLYEKSPNTFSTRIESNNFDKDTINEIKAAFHNSNSIYSLRLCKKLPTYKCFASTYTFLKNVADAGFKLNLTIHTGINDRLNGLSIKTSSLPTAKKTNSIPDHITFLVTIKNIKPGQQPDTETYLEKLRIEKEQKEKGAQADNQSFLSKYWIYIVPFVIIMFLANIVNPEAAAGGGSA